MVSCLGIGWVRGSLSLTGTQTQPGQTQPRQDTTKTDTAGTETQPRQRHNLDKDKTQTGHSSDTDTIQTET